MTHHQRAYRLKQILPLKEELFENLSYYKTLPNHSVFVEYLESDLELIIIEEMQIIKDNKKYDDYLDSLIPD